MRFCRLILVFNVCMCHKDIFSDGANVLWFRRWSIAQTSRLRCKRKAVRSQQNQQCGISLRKYAYLKYIYTYIENFTSKNWKKKKKIQIKNLIFFFIFLHKKIECGYSLEPPRRGGSYEYPQFIFLSKNMKKVMYTPVNPSFTTQKWGLRGSKLYRRVFVMEVFLLDVFT